MAGEENGKVVVDLESDFMRGAIRLAATVARASASVGPTGYGAIVVTDAGDVVVIKAPCQRLEVPLAGLGLRVIHEWGDGERADRIYAGLCAQEQLERSRRN